MSYQMRHPLSVIAMVLALFIGGLALASPAQAASMSCGHAVQSLHEITSPPPSWPGTRAAHEVTRFPGGEGWNYGRTFKIYTKSGWWDLTWDYYATIHLYCD